MGDSIAWQVTPANQNLLFIKPLEENASTNMTVVTTKRIYSFDLSADKAYGNKNRLTYRMRFIYPDEEAAELANIGQGELEGTKLVSGDTSPADWNFEYTYSGETDLRPKQAFDDGKFTYFHFGDNHRSPAIFVVDDHGNESLVNYHKKGDYIVVERLGRRFTLRDGEDVTCIFNENFPVVNFDNSQLAPTAITPVGVSENSDVIVVPQQPAPKPKAEASSGWGITDATAAKKANAQRAGVKR